MAEVECLSGVQSSHMAISAGAMDMGHGAVTGREGGL